MGETEMSARIAGQREQLTDGGTPLLGALEQVLWDLGHAVTVLRRRGIRR